MKDRQGKLPKALVLLNPQGIQPKACSQLKPSFSIWHCSRNKPKDMGLTHQWNEGKTLTLSGHYFVCMPRIADTKLNQQEWSPSLRSCSIDIQYQTVLHRLFEVTEKNRDLLVWLASKSTCSGVVLLTTKAVLCSYSSSTLME